MRTLGLALLLATTLMTACGGDDGDDAADVDAGDQIDADSSAVCTGAAYDSCEDTTAWTDCQDGMECRLFMSQGFTICTPACDAGNPCPDDEDGNPVTCNMMGRCRSSAPNSCTLP